MTTDRRIVDTATRFRRLMRIRQLRRPSISDREVLFLGSLAGMAVGFGLVWLPLGVIIPSVVMLLIAVLSPPANRREEDE